MAPRTIKVLHIEDDALQQRLTAQQLKALPEFSFAITTADSEDGAIAAFVPLQPELVILDYHLTQGNGLSCLQKLRQQDPIVPIVALSGTATPEIAAELLKVGADDYLGKQDLTTEDLARSIREALARADAWRRWGTPAETEATPSPLADQFEELCRWFADHIGDELARRLDAFESAARQTALTQKQTEELFTRCAADSAGRRRLLRPLLLEVLLRLFGDGTQESQSGSHI